MDSKNATHAFRRVFGILATENSDFVFCSWITGDCNDDNQTTANTADCIGKKYFLTTEDLDGALCCKPLDEVSYFDSIRACPSTDSTWKVVIILLILFAIIVVCAKSIRNTCNILLNFGVLSLRNSVGRCAVICAVAQAFVIINISSVVCSYATALVGVTYGTRNNILLIASITLPISLSFAVFATLSMAFNIITVGRTAAMQGFDQKSRNVKRLTFLNRIITVVTVIFSILFFVGSMGGLATIILLGATLLMAIFQTWLFHTAAQLMQDLNASIGNDPASRQSVSKSKAEMSETKGPSTANKMHDNLLKLQLSSSYISKVSAMCSLLMILRAADQFLGFDGALGFNPVRVISGVLQNAAIFFYMLIMDCITSTLYKNKMRNRKVSNTPKVAPSDNLFSATSIVNSEK